MTHTEEEARGKWCPMRDASAVAIIAAGGEPDKANTQATCIASGCIMWAAAEIPAPTEMRCKHCNGTYADSHKKTCGKNPHGAICHVWVDAPTGEPTQVGHCGLAKG